MGLPVLLIMQAHMQIKSTILTNLETWYKNNLASYESKLADTIWCNDKSTVSGGLGYGKNVTDYGAYNRTKTTKQPTLKCPSDNNGGKLSKLTADEIAFAGSAYSYNYSTYLQENTGMNNWWSLSPRSLIAGRAYVSIAGRFVANVSYYFGLRPAISIVSDITISGGTGTSEDPYIVN